MRLLLSILMASLVRCGATAQSRQSRLAHDICQPAYRQHKWLHRPGLEVAPAAYRLGVL